MKIKMIVMSCVLLVSALFICTGNIGNVEAKGISQETEAYLVSASNDQGPETILLKIGENMLKQESSGISELDAAKDRTDKLIEWICRWIGGTIAVVSLIVAAMMASSHQTEQRNTALIVMVLGIVIFFAPQIINYLLGR